MAYNQAKDLREQAHAERNARRHDARAARSIAMQRNPTLRPANQRSSTISRFPFIGFIFQFFAGLISRIGVRNIARRQRPLRILPRIPRDPRFAKGNLAGHARLRFPNYRKRLTWSGPMSHQRREPFGPRHPEINRRPFHLRSKPPVLSRRRRAA